jgi:hypothetical protein
MRQFLVLKAFLAALLLTAVASLGRGEPPSPPKPTLIGVPDEIRAAVIDGHALYALTNKNELLRIDLQAHKATTIVELPAETKAETLTVADGKACIQGRDKKGFATYYVVDETAKKTVQTLRADLAGSGRPGYIVGDRIYAVTGLEVRTYKISTGRPESTIKAGGGILIDSYRVGDRLYLAREYGGGLGIIDMKAGKLLDLIETKDWLFQVRAGKGKAFVWGEFKGVGVIDLKTREYAALEQPEAAASRGALTLQAGPDDGVLVYSPHSSEVFQYNAAGKIVGHTAIDKSAGQFVGAWNGSIVFTSEKGVTLVPLTKPQKERD